MKKIISFSLWGDDLKYIRGAHENLKLQKQFYNDWICRFYVHETVPLGIIDILKKEGAEVVHKTGDLGENMNRPGMFWRFEVIKDPEVERFIIRDVDSCLGQRGKNAVIDWIRSGKNFHIIRDHIYHTTRIMGGMWGATRKIAEKIDYDNLLEKFNKIEQKSIYGTDQDFLAQFIYPIIKDDCLIHDPFHFYKEETVRFIPHIRINGDDFIGKPEEI